MKPRIIFFSLFLAGLSQSLAFAASLETDFQKANQLYREGKFSDSILIYENLAKTYPNRSSIDFNLGNAYFRDGKIGRSILAYERAKFLNPRDQDVRYNLSHVNELLEYRIKDKRNWYIQWGEKILGYFSVHEILLAFLLSYGLFMLSLIYTALFRRGLEWGGLRTALLTLVIFLGVLYGVKHVQTHVIREAIVMARDAEVHYGPSETDQVALRLGEGLKVYVVDHRENWSRVWLTNGESGWMPEDQMAEVRLS